MRKVNSLLYESTERGKFVTAFYGVLNHKNKVLLFSNAGHNPPILLSKLVAGYWQLLFSV